MLVKTRNITTNNQFLNKYIVNAHFTHFPLQFILLLNRYCTKDHYNVSLSLGNKLLKLIFSVDLSLYYRTVINSSQNKQNYFLILRRKTLSHLYHYPFNCMVTAEC